MCASSSARGERDADTRASLPSSKAKRTILRERERALRATWRGTRGRELDRLTQSNLDGREGTAVLGTQRGRSRRLPAPPTPRATEVASRPLLRPQPNTQHPKKVSRWCRGALDITSGTRKGYSLHGRQEIPTKGDGSRTRWI